MALSPLQPIEERAVEVTAEESLLPSKTYAFDFDTGEFTGKMVDETDAVRQFIRKSLATPRFRHLIYDDQIGSELEDLIGEDLPLELVEEEVTRMISEALEYDERIADVNDFVIERTGDQLNIEFTVTLANGVVFTEEVTI